MSINTKSPATFTTTVLIGDPTLSPNGGADSIPVLSRNNDSPVSAALEIQSTDSALLFPRMTTTQRDAIPNPVDGMMIYNTTEPNFDLRIGGAWTEIGVGGADVVGPGVSVTNDIAVFADTTGKVLADSGVPVTQVPQLEQVRQLKLSKGLDAFVNVNQIGNLGHLAFTNGVGLLFVDSLMPVEFIDNNYGAGNQVCSLFTGDLPSSSTTPSALVELQSTTGAFLLSRMTTTQKNALTSPSVGMMVYDTTLGNFSFYNGSWFTPGIGGGSVTNVSGTTGQIDVATGTTTPVISIDPAYIGQTSIITLGTITTGAWNASLIPLAYGGTNANLVASNGGIFYSTGTAGAILSGTATARQVLLSGSSTSPSWSTATYPSTTTINQILYSSSANTIAGISTANSATLVTNSSGVPVFTSSMTNGQVLIGSTGATPTPATLIQGSGITITNGAGTISIAASGASANVVDQTSSSVTMTTNTVYIIDNGASLVTLTLPTTAALGAFFEIIGFSAGGWQIAQATGQTIHFNSTNTTTGTGGSLASSQQYNCVRIRCSKANTDFTVCESQGNLTVV
jgi:hypothetical protein